MNGLKDKLEKLEKDIKALIANQEKFREEKENNHALSKEIKDDVVHLVLRRKHDDKLDIMHEKSKELQDKEKELKLRIIPLTTISNEQTIMQAMSQVRQKYLQLTRLKNKNKILENLALQMEQERKTWESKYQYWEAKWQELQTKNDKIIK